MESAIIYITKLLNYEEYLENVEVSIKNKFSKKGEEIVNNNISSIKEVEENIKEIDVDSSWKELDVTEEELNGIFDYISHMRGDELSVKEFIDHKDGTYSCDTSKLEKRDVAETLPRWIQENCIQFSLLK